MINKEFYRTFLKIGLPIALSQLLSSSLMFVDTLMIGDINEKAVAAVGAASQIFFIFGVSLYGIYSAGGIFTSQYWGKKNIKALHQIMGIMLVFGIPFALLAMVVLFLYSRQIIGLVSNDLEMIAYGSQYLIILAPSLMLTTISFLYAYVSRSIHMTQYPLYISTFALLLNTFLNYVLIYGAFGFPRLEVEGAAIASLLSKAVELLLFFALLFFFKSHPLRAGFADLFSFNFLQLKKFVKKGISVFLNEVSWVLGQSIFFIAYGWLGTQALSSVQIGHTLSGMAVSLFTGIASACSVMVGNALGRNELQLADSLSKRFQKLALLVSLAVTVVMIIVAVFIPNFYPKFRPETIQLTIATTIVMALYKAPAMYNYIASIGVLRSGGDTLFCMLSDVFGVYFIGIPLAFLTAGVLKLPIYLVVAFAYSEEIVKALLFYWRIKTGKWQKNLVADV